MALLEPPTGFCCSSQPELSYVKVRKTALRVLPFRGRVTQLIMFDGLFSFEVLSIQGSLRRSGTLAVLPPLELLLLLLLFKLPPDPAVNHERSAPPSRYSCDASEDST